MSDATTLPLTGGCNCGAVRFEVSAPLSGAMYCHCTRCQRRTGTAAAVTAGVAPGSVLVLSGEREIAAWEPADGFAKVFCRACGSALFTRDPASGAIVGVRMGAFDRDPGVRASARQYTAYAAVWEPLPDDGLTRYPERRP